MSENDIFGCAALDDDAAADALAVPPLALVAPSSLSSYTSSMRHVNARQRLPSNQWQTDCSACDAMRRAKHKRACQYASSNDGKSIKTRQQHSHYLVCSCGSDAQHAAAQQGARKRPRNAAKDGTTAVCTLALHHTTHGERKLPIVEALQNHRDTLDKRAAKQEEGGSEHKPSLRQQNKSTGR